jgi:guanylate kinase
VVTAMSLSMDQRIEAYNCNNVHRMASGLCTIFMALRLMLIFIAQGSPLDRQPIVISGPSGVGKGTLRRKLLNLQSNDFSQTVSHTTRKPRAGESEGIDYYFVSFSHFTTLLSEDSFVEHTFSNGNYYGTSKQTIKDQTAKGSIVLIEVDMKGVQQIKKDSGIDARYVFIKPLNFETLETRLRSRGSEDEEDIRSRLNQARAELEYADIPGVHDKILVNDDLETAFKELCDFVYQSPPIL